MIIDLDGDPQPFMEFCSAVRRNSRLFNLPIVLLAPQEALGDANAAIWEGITDVIFKPVKAGELEARIVSLIAELRFRDSLRAIYQEARHMATSDGLTGLYSRGFLLEQSAQYDRRCAAACRYILIVPLWNYPTSATLTDRFGYVVGGQDHPPGR